MLAILLSFALSTLNLIPEPKQVKVSSGTFSLKTNTGLYYDTSVDGLLDVVNYAARILRVSTGYAFQYKTSSANNQINFVLSSTQLGKEEYKLSVESNIVTITASTSSGFLYGFETLLQLFPPEIYGKKTGQNVNWQCPCVEITDLPRYEWRGVLLDVSRHFYDVDAVKKLLDSMAFHKLNILHFHLTDDQGWRIEIKKYPKLTSIGSISKSRPKPWNADQSDNIQYGPYYYTQENIQELVKYAAARGITIIPEVDFPGHSLAALSAFPELSCKGGPFEPLSDMTTSEDVFCPGNDKAIETAKDIIDEIVSIFGHNYIHIGGDRCSTSRWEQCEKCKKRYQDHKLTDYDQLRHYFVQQILEHTRSKGYVTIGWDDVYNVHLNRSTIVMGNHLQSGVNAANDHYKVVMTPSTRLYMSQYQYTTDDSFEYAPYGYKTLSIAYNYDGTEGIFDDCVGNIIGLQGSLWTEFVWGEDEDMFYKLYPRMCAIAESAWTSKENRNYNRFLGAFLRMHQSRLDNAHITHASVGQGNINHWTSDNLKDDEFVTMQWPLPKSVNKVGPYEVAFILKHGNNGIKIQNVRLCIGEKNIAVSTEEGEATYDDSKNSFHLKTFEPGNDDVVLRADIKGIDGTDSNGDIVLSYTSHT